MIGGIGMPELIVIMIIVLIVFGAGKLPEIGKGLGKAIGNFKKSVNEEDDKKATRQLDDKEPADKPQ